MAEKKGEGQQPLIIKKINKGHAGAHGGAWKVAFADFATAMMAFFMLMWLMGGTSNEEKAAISKYFQDPGGAFIGEGGANASAIDLGEPKLPTTSEVPETLTPGGPASESDEMAEDSEAAMAKKLEEMEQQQLETLKENLLKMVESNAAFADYKDQIIVDITPEGLRIQIVDKDKRAMFDSGSPQLQYYSMAILENLAKLITQVPNRISIVGHTDAAPLNVDEGKYTNWELSADRANAARRALEHGGVKPSQVARVEGFSDTVLFNQNAPDDPINRRIAIIILKKKVDDAIKSNALGEWAKPAEPDAVPVDPMVPPATEPHAETPQNP